MGRTPGTTAGRRWAVLRDLISREPATAFQARHALISFLAKRVGTRAYDAYTTWHDDPEFIRVWEGSAWPADAADARKYTLFQLVRMLGNVPGDTAECGCYQGMASYLMLAAERRQDREHHVFDSFSGLSEPGRADSVETDGVLRWKHHDLTASEAGLRERLARFDNWHSYAGWIPERFEEISDRRFSLVHVDVDLYDPTKASFEFFYPRMSPGGVIVCDDYGFSSCPGALRAVDEFAQSVGNPPLVLPTGQALLFARQ